MSERESYPAPTAAPCNDCPWRRIAKVGWLGPHSAIEWLESIHGEGAIACHKTIRSTDETGHGDWDHPAMRQCRGAAIFRLHVGKQPRNSSLETGPFDPEHVFVSNAEFLAYHTGEEMTERDLAQAISRRRLYEEAKDEAG